MIVSDLIFSPSSAEAVATYSLAEYNSPSLVRALLVALGLKVYLP